MSDQNNKIGRPKAPPIEYTNEQLDLAIELAAKGESLKTIINSILTSEIHFWRYRQDNPNFQKSFDSARQEGLEHLADALITMADDYIDVQRARLKSDNHKWLLSKRKPTTYGDKVDIHVSQTIDLSGAIKEARSRIETPRLSKEYENSEMPLAGLIDVTPKKVWQDNEDE
jgi:hypothetical protein